MVPSGKTDEVRMPNPRTHERRISAGVTSPDLRILNGMDERCGVEEAPIPETLAAEECEVCGAEMFGLHCKLVCPNCGYRRDCSDP